jgi:hypothetical protein
VKCQKKKNSRVIYSLLILVLIFRSLVIEPIFSDEFHFSNVKFSNIVQIISKKLEKNIVIDHKITDFVVTINLKNSSVESLLELLLKLNNLSRSEFSENTIIIHPKNQIAANNYGKPTIKIFKTSFIDSKKAVDILESAYPLLSFSSSDKYTIVVSGIIDEKIKLSLIKLIDSFDIKPTLVNFKIFFIDGGNSFLKERDFNFSISQISNPVLSCEFSLNNSRFSNNIEKTFMGTIISGSDYSFFAGKTLPIVTLTSENSSEVTMTNVGDLLNLRVINSNENIINLSISMDISTILNLDRNIFGGRRVETMVSLKSGETVVIGGLIENNYYDSKKFNVFVNKVGNSTNNSLILLWADIK